MSALRSVIAVRHCESSGRAPEAPLTARGRDQAERLATSLDALAISRVVSSPHLRARETIAPLARRRGIDVHVDDRLRERSLCAAPREDWRDHVARAFVELDVRAPGGESAREALARGWAALNHALASPGTLLASHGQLLSLVLHHIDPRFGFAQWESMTTPDVFRITCAEDGVAYERLAF